MLFIIGLLIVVGCVIGGYMGAGGHMGVLWQPYEYVIIFGAAIGALVIGSPAPVLKGLGGGFKVMLAGLPYQKKKPYMELMGFFFELSKMMRTKGIKEVEQHIDHPHDSALFQKYPSLMKDHHVEAFICDNVRLIVMGSGMPNQLEELMDEELHIHHTERGQLVGAMQNMADGMPALGIVAAVLGVIHTMGSITEPPEVLGHLIGAALVGTFSGVLIAYGFVGPMAKNMEAAYASESAFYLCAKIAILNFARQLSPQIIAEFTRKHMPASVRPSFQESEQYLGSLGGGA
ncbi:MAG: flagellar motor stator protein MotA [Alphaproteobacteria bacterium]|nr:MAG: flagellar motor stator protein MotA [Alphaproteobacteria bacterium]